MTRVIVHVVAFIGAVIAAADLHMLGRDVFGLSSEMMFDQFACVCRLTRHGLCILCVG